MNIRFHANRLFPPFVEIYSLQVSEPKVILATLLFREYNWNWILNYQNLYQTPAISVFFY